MGLNLVFTIEKAALQHNFMIFMDLTLVLFWVIIQNLAVCSWNDLRNILFGTISPKSVFLSEFKGIRKVCLREVINNDTQA